MNGKCGEDIDEVRNNALSLKDEFFHCNCALVKERSICNNCSAADLWQSGREVVEVVTTLPEGPRASRPSRFRDNSTGVRARRRLRDRSNASCPLLPQRGFAQLGGALRVSVPRQDETGSIGTNFRPQRQQSNSRPSRVLLPVLTVFTYRPVSDTAFPLPLRAEGQHRRGRRRFAGSGGPARRLFLKAEPVRYLRCGSVAQRGLPLVFVPRLEPFSEGSGAGVVGNVQFLGHVSRGPDFISKTKGRLWSFR